MNQFSSNFQLQRSFSQILNIFFDLLHSVPRGPAELHHCVMSFDSAQFATGNITCPMTFLYDNVDPKWRQSAYIFILELRNSPIIRHLADDLLSLALKTRLERPIRDVCPICHLWEPTQPINWRTFGSSVSTIQDKIYHFAILSTKRARENIMDRCSCFFLVLALQLIYLKHAKCQTSCADVGTVCASLADQCNNGNLYLNGLPISVACPETCNRCVTTATSTVGPCVDMSNACTKISYDKCFDETLTINGMSVDTYCPVTCGNCPTTTIPPPTTSK